MFPHLRGQPGRIAARTRHKRISPRLESVEPRLLLDGAVGPIAAQVAVAQVEPVAEPAPTVVSVQRLGVHGQPTRIAVTFSQPMNPASVLRAGSYLLEVRAPDGRDRPLVVVPTRYDAASQTVILSVVPVRYDESIQRLQFRPTRGIPLHGPLRLTINGNFAGLASDAGILLDGDGNGQPGGNFETTLRGLSTSTSRVLHPHLPGLPQPAGLRPATIGTPLRLRNPRL